MLPQYLYRNDDGERFTLQDDGQYTMDSSIGEPYRYTYKTTLIKSKFKESIKECDLKSQFMNKPESKDGGNAFPYRETDNNGQYRDHFGLSIREYIAAKSLQGYRANPTCYSWDSEIVAGKAISDADALIAKLDL